MKSARGRNAALKPALSPPRHSHTGFRTDPTNQVSSVQASQRPHDLPAPEFDQAAFSRWLRMLLVAFYNDDELVVGDFLCRRAALLRDTALSEKLGLPDRQVRMALERRLVPDRIVERLNEGTNTQGSQVRVYYRISKNAMVVAARRLHMLEESLATSAGAEAEEYFCQKCRRAYSSLEAVSFTNQQFVQESKEGDGSVRSVFSFRCQECGEELVLASEEKKVLRERLQRFRTQCRDLLLLTRELQDMPIPIFEKDEQKPKLALPSADSATAAGTSNGAETASAEKTSTDSRATVNGNHTHGGAKQDARRDEWFHREVLGTEPFRAGTDLQRQSSVAEEDVAYTQALQQAHVSLRTEANRRIAKGLSSQKEKDTQPATRDETTITVQGKVQLLSRVRGDEEMLDLMTDEEYQRYHDLERKLQKRSWMSRAGEKM